MTNYISIPLDIDGVAVDRVDMTAAGELHVYVKSTIEGTHCHHCGHELKAIHDYGREVKLRHLSILGMPTYIIIRPRRYRCDRCEGKPTTTQRLPWYDQRTSTTRAFADHVLNMLVNSTVYDVSHKEKIGCDTIEDIIAREIGVAINWSRFTQLPKLGIDEISLKKGHRDFATIVTVRTEKGKVELLGVLDNREKETVKQFFLSIPKPLRDTVREVCSDLYEGFTEAAREVFGENVIITADRFHVAKLYREVVDDIRIKEMRRLQKELSEEAYEKLKGAMWIIRKSPSDIEDEELDTLQALFTYSPTLKLAYLCACALTEIFDKPVTKTEGKEMIRAWMAVVRNANLSEFDKFLHTLEEKLDLITNYFVNRQSSGFIEGINHKTRVLIGRCYGLFNRVHLFQRLTLDLGGHETYA